MPKARVMSSGAARTRPGAKAKAKAARQKQLDWANARQKLRREALARLNTLADEVGYTAQALVLKTADNDVVEQRVRVLQRRCHSDELHQRLHAAAKLYTDNGGRFSVDLVEQPTPDETDISPVAKHKVLRGDFRLRSSAFMLIYRSSTFTGARWLPFAVEKMGTVWAATNFKAWCDYTALISWVDGLHSAQKLTHAQCLSMCRSIGTGYAARKRDVLEVMRDELEASMWS